MPTARTRLAPRRQIGRYLVESEIGRGGMAVVYAAEDPLMGRRVALKVLTPALAADPAFVARFQEERRLTGTLEHPHIVPVYEIGQDDDELFIAMRLIEGDDLRTLVERDGPLPADRTARIVRHIAGALDAAHARGLLHRDVKPANILVTGSGEHEHAYLVDFGLVRHAGAERQLTQPGEWIGTLDYAAPEQVEGAPLSGAADVHALACVAFFSLTGHTPFPGTTTADKLRSRIAGEPLRATGRPAVDAELAVATHRDPARRPDALTFARRLARALERDAAAPTRVAARVDAPRRGVLAAGIAAVLAAVALVLLLGGDDHAGESKATAARTPSVTTPAVHRRAAVVAPRGSTYTAPAGGYVAEVPQAGGWAIQGEQDLGGILRTTVTGPDGAQLWIDSTPRMAPGFGTEGRTLIQQTTRPHALGTVRSYRFTGAPDAVCGGGCVDDQLDLGGHGFAVLGGPTPQARAAAHAVMRSLRPTAPAAAPAAVPPAGGKAKKPHPGKKPKKPKKPKGPKRH